MYPCDLASKDEGHCKKGKDPVPSLERDFRSAGVREAYVVATREEVNLPRLVSNSLLVECKSMH